MKRVVITGLGLVTSLGHTVEETWEALCQGRSGIGPISQFDASEYPVRFAGEVRNFDPSRYLEHKEIRRNDAFTHLAVAASRQALVQARLSITEQLAPHIGVCSGSGVGGLMTLHKQFAILHEKGPKRVSPFLVPMMMINAAPGIVSLLTGAQGPAWATVSACATGANALGEAWETICRGAARAMLAGGAEKAVTPLAMAAFANMHALSRRNDDPQGASRPFDAERDGFVMGEGAGILLLEELEFALERRAPILAELVGYGSTADAYHMTEPALGGEGLVRAMECAWQRAGLRPQDVQYINVTTAGRVPALVNKQIDATVMHVDQYLTATAQVPANSVSPNVRRPDCRTLHPHPRVRGHANRACWHSSTAPPRLKRAFLGASLVRRGSQGYRDRQCPPPSATAYDPPFARLTT